MALDWPLMIGLAVFVSVAVVLTGLSFVAIWRRPSASTEMQRWQRVRDRLGLSLLGSLPLGWLGGGMIALGVPTK